MSTTQNPIHQNKLKYIECGKRGYHFGQALNMVCIQPSCLQSLTCCCACIEQNHKNHETKPLKVVLKQAKKHSENLKHSVFDSAKLVQMVNQRQQKTLEILGQKRNQMIESLNHIEKSILGYYSSILQKISIKDSDPKVQVDKAFNIIYSEPTIEEFNEAVKKLASIMPVSFKGASSGINPEQEIQTEEDMIDSIQSATLDIAEQVEEAVGGLNAKLGEFKAALQNNINTKNIWEKSCKKYKFNPAAKHMNVKLNSELMAKSINTSGYKFAVMDPSLEKNLQKPIKIFSFRIKECTSNWVAVGMCHKNMVTSKNFGFNFGGVGHGGYLISANGGSWSNIKAEFNNSIKSFKFVKGDVITITVNLQISKIHFQKKNDSYELDFKKIEGDQLYPCALFYYINDEVQFLPNYKPQ